MTAATMKSTGAASTAAPLILERFVELLDSEGRAEGEPRPLSDLFREPKCLVLLGDPGMGKTTALSTAAAAVPGSVLKSVRIFAPGTMTEDPGEGILLLDALDEAMAAGSQDPLGAVAARLEGLHYPRFWLSCRAVDWAGQATAGLLRECAPSGLMVARLLPLNDDQIDQLAQAKGSSGATLLEAMRKTRLVPLLRNPWTLNLVLDVAASGLPTSRHDLFERAAELLSREKQDRPGNMQVAPSEISTAAGAIFAALLISGVNAITTTIGGSAAASITEFGQVASAAAVNAALRSRLFASAGENTWEPQHRTIAEFLGARFLAERIVNHGLPLRRVLALIQGGAPTPHPSLRGLFAWLATLLPAHRATALVEMDPYGVLSYGDPIQTAPMARKGLLLALGKLAEREPWFRMHSWSEANFSALAAPELVPELRDVLAERPVRPHLLSCVCDALSESEPLQDLSADLAGLLLDPQVPAAVRLFAVKAFLHISSSTPEVAPALFRQLLAQPGLDPEALLSGYLLRLLYPDRLSNADLVAFLDRWVEGAESDDVLISYYLPPLIPAGAEPELLNLLAIRSWTTSQDSPPRDRIDTAQSLIGLIAARAIKTLAVADASQIAVWFKMLATYSVRQAKELRAAFAARVDLLPSLVILTSEGLTPEKVLHAPWEVLSLLGMTLMEWSWPAEAAARLLAASECESDSSRAARLFAAALGIFKHSAEPRNEWFEKAWSFGQSRDDLRTILTALCAPNQIARHIQEALKRNELIRAEQEASAATFHRKLETQKADIQSGVDVESLSLLGKFWFDNFFGGTEFSNLTPADRLRKNVSNSVANAAEQGFRQLTSNGRIPSPRELADHAKTNTLPYCGFAVLAGADLLFSDAGYALPNLSTDRLTSLVCLALTIPPSPASVDNYPNHRAWVACVVAALPNKSAQALRDLIIPQLTADTTFVTGLHTICQGPELSPVQLALVPDFLRLASAPNVFDPLVATALRIMPMEQVYGIALDQLALMHNEPDMKLWPWLHLAWRLTPGPHETRITALLCSNPDLHILLAEATGDSLARISVTSTPLTLEHRSLILRELGLRYAPVPLPRAIMGVPSSYQLGQVVQAQIDWLSRSSDKAAEVLLEEAVTNPAYIAHREYLQQSLAVWRRGADLRAWEAPSVGAVCAALQAGSPTSPSGLIAFADEHLQELKDTLRRTEDNEWRTFWNTDSVGPVDAKVENFCRDQLVIFLRGRFERAGLGLATEVRHAGDGRCDIVARTLNRTLPIEVKCDWHDKLWTAWRDQLALGYSREPKAAEIGIYLVFWFGPRRGRSRSVSLAPDGSRTQGAEEFECKLSALVSESGLPVRVVVLDVTAPNHT